LKEKFGPGAEFRMPCWAKKTRKYYGRGAKREYCRKNDLIATTLAARQ